MHGGCSRFVATAFAEFLLGIWILGFDPSEELRENRLREDLILEALSVLANKESIFNPFISILLPELNTQRTNSNTIWIRHS